MPIRSHNAHATFQRSVGALRVAMKWLYALVYLDRDVTLSQAPFQRNDQITTVSRIVKNAGGTVNLGSSFFFTDIIE